MKHILLKLFAILYVLITLQSCGGGCWDYNPPYITMTVYNPTDHVIKVSYPFLVLKPGQKESTILGGDTLPPAFHNWGDTVRFTYDDTSQIMHVRSDKSLDVMYSPDSNNILDTRSWRYVGNRTYEYVIDSAIPCDP